MHADRTVRRESIVAWYRWYSRNLPRMHPERSDVDLIRTAALWMQLTDRGGSPGFPFDYGSELSFPDIDPASTRRASPWWLLGVLTVGAGVILLFFTWKLGLALVAAGELAQCIGYWLCGGPTNPELMTHGANFYERGGRRVIDWAAEHRR